MRLPRFVLAAVLAGAAAVHAQTADDDRGVPLYLQWMPAHKAEVAAFEAFLAEQKVKDVVPTYQLLRSASMWRECNAAPFQVPPPAQWPLARDVLLLLQELRRTNVLGPFAVASAYRDPTLNRCAHGSKHSSHMRFAVDIVPLGPTDDQKLCAFWRAQGQAWNMGLSRYPSGRIHVDRTGWRTWGEDYTLRSSYCNQLAQKRP
ncbi:D-Ala-D-Ala carboxypeptidase family metallohydrolase [Ramlibacter sp. XY19]|uniref:D-Ala-D-Ala carboxypeptidase family metallohydrolase n=1 Tax=Ramlibacter paludis TaxID=2908000 RepID=UPI0023DB205F|nr:D-Ala-D-Ala carboxypeptidase family metallohydrolase [Ramlibacter paludis]MCG2595794.1 D-Ala-D-Ala carboxypeptidase family metallohydrolase [Ramlibacter paludis]